MPSFPSSLSLMPLVLSPGGCEEAISFYTVRWEEGGVSNLLKLWARHGPPPSRAVLSAVPPAAIGFIAFEFGRELVLRKAGPEEDDD